ncbi:MAG: dihydroorotase [Eubacteriales bacterium]|nr:dihydroorotase [Eubacteriales bacterium]MDY3332971.1 dihydroorotase [Gallibacter sp.]
MNSLEKDLKLILNKWKNDNKDLYNHAKEFIQTNQIDYIDLENLLVMPSFCDVHVHFREPGYSYKETIKIASKAAAAGGYTTVFTMPNLKPVPDNYEHLKVQLDIIKEDSCIEILPYGSITVDENGKTLSDMQSMKDYVVAYSDDGVGVQSEYLMKEAMNIARYFNKKIVAHCEVNSLLNGGYIHDGEYARLNSHKGICSASEYEQAIRDIKLSQEVGCDYHICHVSTAETVEAVRIAKKSAKNMITCETAPHYLVLTDMDLQEEGRFKMNPPIRSDRDRSALIQGIKDGTVEIIATDHAPHSKEEKSRGLAKSAMGIVGLETAFPVLFTRLVLKNIISLKKLIELISTNPRRIFGINNKRNDFTVFDISSLYNIDSKNFISTGKATPFDGYEVYGKCLLTVHNNKIVYNIYDN